ncbi:DUF262 domain-containing protein [Streptomyces marokkonensis]|uniref:DUF262 domain-containing protein n=1 Tax=Streptomyces marokkonensis TaxID=324855 RepID=A0ABW6Q0J6_9ACTN
MGPRFHGRSPDDRGHLWARFGAGDRGFTRGAIRHASTTVRGRSARDRHREGGARHGRQRVRAVTRATGVPGAGCPRGPGAPTGGTRGRVHRHRRQYRHRGRGHRRGRADAFDPELIDVAPRNPTVDLVLQRLQRGLIDLQPDFQRRSGIWNDTARSRLIESLLLRIALPTLYVAEEADESWSVVDGVQRLTSIVRFVQPETAGLKPLRLEPGVPDPDPVRRRRLRGPPRQDADPHPGERALRAADPQGDPGGGQVQRLLPGQHRRPAPLPAGTAACPDPGPGPHFPGRNAGRIYFRLVHEEKTIRVAHIGRHL